MEKNNKNNIKTILKILFLSSTLVYSNQSLADQFHYKNIIVGDRASGLAGAYTAVADDPSGLFYNPAGIVYAKEGNLSASVNAYHTSTKTYKDALAGSIDWERTSAAFLPNFFAFTQPLGPGVIGFSYAVPDAVSENQDQTFLNPNTVWTSLTVNYNDEDLTYKIGPSYAIELTKGFSMGATLYFHYRERERISNELAVQPGLGPGGDYQISNTYFETYETGFQPMLGIIWSPINKFSFGLNISQTIINSSRTTLQTQQKAFNQEEVQETYTRIDETRQLPIEAALGMAWFPSSSLMIAGDLTHYTATEDEISGTREAITNFAVGLEYYASSSLAYRAGVYSNYANTPGLVEGASGQNEHINYYGLTASISSVTRNSTISLGLGHSIGSGLAQVVSGTTELQDVEGSSTFLSLSTSYSY